jgi:hypothetical protein
VLFVGAIFGLEAASALSVKSGWILSTGLPVMIGYAIAASLAALALGSVTRLRASFWERLALSNAVAVPLCIAALYAVSRSTEVTVSASGDVREYSWFPVWLAVGLTGLALVWAVRAAIRAGTPADLRALERRLLLVVAGPVAILLLVAVLPGAWPGIDMFHEGELLAGSRLVEEGAFPWRDLIFIHGLLTDVALQSIGFNLFEESRWGYVAGTLVVVIPLYWILFYYLFAYLFHRNWLFLVGTQLAVILGVVFEDSLRFILLPLVLLLLAALLSKPSGVRAVSFMTVVVAQTVVTPEAGIAALAVLSAIVAFEAYYYDRSKSLTENFRRTLLCAGAGTLLTLVWAAFLLAFGALDDFVFAYLTFASDHQLTGGTPVDWVSDRYRFAAVAPVVLVVLAFWYFAVQILRRGPITVADWIMGALALFIALYYHKFLARSDHVFQPYAVALPLLYYALYRLIGVTEEAVGRIAPRLGARLPIRLGVTAVAVVILLLQAPITVADRLADAPRRLDATVAEEAHTRMIGFFNPEGEYDQLLRELNTTIRAYVGPDDEIFDFSNNPAVFHYFLERRPSTRYYHVSMAIREETQEDLVEELDRQRPKLVVFSSSGTGLGSWDGISNQVRHYRVSQYLLDHYRPLLEKAGFIFMARKGAELAPEAALAERLGKPDTKNLHFRTYACDWGYAPNFLEVRPGAPATARPLSLVPRELSRQLSVSGWAVDRDAGSPAVNVVAAVGGKIVAQAAPSTDRPDIMRRLRDRAYLASGFVLEVPPGSIPGARVQAVRIYGLSRSGKATELGYGPGASWGVGRPPGPRTLRLGEREVPVVEGAAEGFADSSSATGQLIFALDVPNGAQSRAYDWLEIETRSPLQANGFTLSDDPTRPDRGISFKTLARGETRVRVLVGACSQWHGYRSRRLYLIPERREPIEAVRLYR